MAGLRKFWFRWRRVWPLLTLLLGGCASTVRLPAIDPTGQQIFLPQPAYTNLESPLAALHPNRAGRGGWPRPAFTQPPAIPFCPPAPIGVPAASVPTIPVQPAVPVVVDPLATLQDRLVLTPARIVAPINTEVILLAGICGPDGYYVTRQPIEWTLSQESVGQFVDVGEKRHVTAFHRASPQKFSNDFALSRTSTTAQKITRGTPSPQDDILLQKGQTWISVVSSSQGVSHVTAVATGAENWEQRRQLARIHWVDAEWVLPAPAIVKAGTVHTLSTKITRSTGGEPVAGWTVTYELAGGVPARLGQLGESAVNVLTDSQGLASVSLAQDGATPGSSRVLIRIRTPADGDQPIEVGQGFTTVTWSAPGLDLKVAGPELATPDSTISYRIEVTNPGDLPAHNVVVSATVPPSLNFLNADPPTAFLGNRLTWNLGSLAAGTGRTIGVNCRASRDGSVRFQVEARADGISPARLASAATEVLSQSLEVNFVDPPVTAVIGEPTTFNIEITNLGARALTNVTLIDSFDAGLEYAGGQSPIRKSVPSIEVGSSARIAVRFIPRQSGRLCHTLEVSAENGHHATKTACITVSEPHPGIRVEKSGPGQAQVGEQVDFVIVVTNTGDAILNNVRVVDAYPGPLTPIEATDGYEHTDAGMEWLLPTLAPREEQRLQVVYQCLNAARQAQNRVTVTSDEGARDVAAVTIDITSAPSDPTRNRVRRVPTPESTESASGKLEVGVTATDRIISVGNSLTYTITLKNESETSDKGVVVSFQLPAGQRFKRFNSVSAELALRPPKEGLYAVEQIAEIRAGGKRQFEIEVIADEPGKSVFEVQVESLRHSEPIVRETSIEVRE